jgi:hypothetical protein
MADNIFIPSLYHSIDAMDTAKVVSNMTGDSIFRFANMPAVEGKDNISAFLDSFFQSIKAIHHSELEYWTTAGVWFVTGYANYTRHNDSVLRVPFGVLLRMRGALIRDWNIFVDNSELYSS